MENKTTRESPKYMIRFPEGLREELSAIASREGRSLNSLIVELLGEKVARLRSLSVAADHDLLATAYYAAESAEMYAMVARGAMIRLKRREGEMKTSPSADIPEPAIPELGSPDAQLNPFERELLEEAVGLSPEEQAAMLTLAKRK